jgi:hypothetical protein
MASLVCGCQKASGPARMAVGGTVTRAGVPLANGLISFRPAKGAPGPAATTGIRKGRYQFDSRNGPTAGPHEVFIQTAIEDKRTEAPRVLPQAESPPTTEALTPWTFEIDVPANSPDDIPFDIP